MFYGRNNCICSKHREIHESMWLLLLLTYPNFHLRVDTQGNFFSRHRVFPILSKNFNI